MSPSSKSRGGEGDAPADSVGRELVSTGIEGLDHVLGGGLVRSRAHLVHGPPGAGKTTLALQFLLAGTNRGEAGLYISLSETEDEIQGTARSHGWALNGLHIFDASAIEQLTSLDLQQTLFHHSEVELTETTRALVSQVQQIKPARLVFDPITEFRLLADDPLRYRRQIVALKQLFADLGSTVLLIEDLARQEVQSSVATLVHSIVRLDPVPVDFGPYRRRLRVEKVRSGQFREGLHDYLIKTGGIEVFPRLVAAETRRTFTPQRLLSGISGLDEMFGGGLDEGSSTLLIGPSGIGKSSVALQYVSAMARQGAPSLVFLYEERPETLLSRMTGLGVGLKEQIDSGLVTLRQIDPAELTPGEFVDGIRVAVERHGVKVVVIDSLTGYLSAVPDERFPILKLNELLTYLGQQGVTTLLVCGQQGLFTPTAGHRDVEVSYLADNVLLFRYYEHGGEVRQAVSVFKRRGGEHERTIRDLWLGADGIKIGAPLRGFRAVLSGQPVLADDAEHPRGQ